MKPWISTILAVALVAACRPDSSMGYSSGDTDDGPPTFLDSDGDGRPDSIDCAPADPTIAPGLPEDCDGVDNNCDERVDEGCGGDRCGSITTDTTWGPARIRVLCDVTVEGESHPILTIAPGTEVVFAREASLEVGIFRPGALVVDGDGGTVTFTSAGTQPRPGDWDGLVLGQNAMEETSIRGAVIEYAGGASGRGAALWLDGTPSVTISDVEIRDSLGAGAVLRHESGASFAGVTFAGNGGIGLDVGRNATLVELSDAAFTANGAQPVVLPAEAVGQIVGMPQFDDNADEVVVITGGYVAQSQVWEDYGIPYRLTDEVYVQASGTDPPVLTLASGARLEFAANVGLRVGYGAAGGLVVDGTAGDPVVFGPAPETGLTAWRGLYIGDESTVATLRGCVIEGGGGGDYGAGLHAFFTSVTLADCLIRRSAGAGIRAQNSTVSVTGSTIRDVGVDPTGKGGDGVRLEGALAEIGEWSGNIFTGNQGHPVVVTASSAHRLDAASSYTGNRVDTVVVLGGAIKETVTWPALEVPWEVAATIYVLGPHPRPLLQIADATLLLAPGAAIEVGTIEPGDLDLRRSVVTSASPSPSPGAWSGIIFGAQVTNASVVLQSEVSFGGNVQNSTYSANVQLGGGVHVSVRDSVLANAAGYGIYCTGGCAQYGGMLSGNTFTGNTQGSFNP